MSKGDYEKLVNEWLNRGCSVIDHYTGERRGPAFARDITPRKP